MALNTILHDQFLVNQYSKEYLETINKYMNASRKSIYVKYYNLNLLASEYNNELLSTFDKFKLSELKYDLYDHTPAFNINPISNRSSNVTDLNGQRFDGASSITIYTIKEPRINDIICFYAPFNTTQYFTVVNITTSIPIMCNQVEVLSFELELDYAPIKNIEDIKLRNHYVYDPSKEKYLTFDQYKEYILFVNDVIEFTNTLNNFYSHFYDLYICYNYISIEINEMIFYLKSFFDKDYKRIFPHCYSPFGYLDMIITNYPFKYNSLDDISFENGLSIYNLETKTITEYDNSNEELNQLFISSQQFLNNIKQIILTF